MWVTLKLHDAGANPEAHFERQQMIAAVELAMSRMAPKCLEVFRLRKIDGASHAMIAQQMGISTKTVERHMTRALQLCHEALLEKPHKMAELSSAVAARRQQE